MIAYKLTTEQAEQLRHSEFMPDNYFNPIADINGEFFITIEEINQCTNEDCLWVKYLPEHKYISPIIETIN